MTDIIELRESEPETYSIGFEEHSSSPRRTSISREIAHDGVDLGKAQESVAQVLPAQSLIQTDAMGLVGGDVTVGDTPLPASLTQMPNGQDVGPQEADLEMPDYYSIHPYASSSSSPSDNLIEGNPGGDVPFENQSNGQQLRNGLSTATIPAGLNLGTGSSHFPDNEPPEARCLPWTPEEHRDGMILVEYLLQQGVLWRDIPSAYKEHIGIKRTKSALRQRVVQYRREKREKKQDRRNVLRTGLETAKPARVIKSVHLGLWNLG